MRMNYADVGVIHAATQITAFPALLVLARLPDYPVDMLQ